MKFTILLGRLKIFSEGLHTEGKEATVGIDVKSAIGQSLSLPYGYPNHE
jgi:hypothetical protein